MTQQTETYYARRVRQSDAAMRGAHDPSARLAHARLKTAYERLDCPVDDGGLSQPA